MNTWVIFIGSESSVFTGNEGLSSEVTALLTNLSGDCGGLSVVITWPNQLWWPVELQDLASLVSFSATHRHS